MITYAQVLKLIRKAKVDAETLEQALEQAQAPGQGTGRPHAIPKPGDQFDPVALSGPLKADLERFNASMKALETIRNQGGGHL